MPYIIQEKRKKLDPIIAQITALPLLSGDVNFVITCILESFYGAPLYEGLNSGLGVLEAVKQEFYRRRVVPFEEQKKRENGEVYL